MGNLKQGIAILPGGCENKKLFILGNLSSGERVEKCF